MKRVKGVFIIIIISLITYPVFADAGKHDITTEGVIKQILIEQVISNKDDINPKKVSDELLEELGEAYMSQTHPNEKQHEWMDEMMGGEGSASLRRIHINMGYSYLSGDNRSYGMMGGRSGMMGF